MSFATLSIQCRGVNERDMPPGTSVLIPPDHERCPGGQHMPGVLGGWHCTCSCHRAVAGTDLAEQGGQPT